MNDEKKKKNTLLLNSKEHDSKKKKTFKIRINLKDGNWRKKWLTQKRNRVDNDNVKQTTRLKQSDKPEEKARKWKLWCCEEEFLWQRQEGS